MRDLGYICALNSCTACVLLLPALGVVLTSVQTVSKQHVNLPASHAPEP